MTESCLPGVMEIQSQIYQDDRGNFRQLYDPLVMESLGVEKFAQSNLSSSRKNVFRGFHLQLQPEGQGKLVHCLQGSIVDFILDPDPGSSEFGRIQKIQLDSYSRKSVWIPGHFAHAFLSLEPDTWVVYATSSAWNPALERAISPLSTALVNEIDFANVTMSDRDRNAPSIVSIGREISKGAV